MLLIINGCLYFGSAIIVRKKKETEKVIYQETETQAEFLFSGKIKKGDETVHKFTKFWKRILSIHRPIYFY